MPTKIAAAQTAVHDVVGSIEHAEVLDAPAAVWGRTVRGALPTGTAKEVLSGTWSGHALHPVLTVATIGMWTSGLLLDATGDREGADRLVGAGILCAIPTAMTGSSDWADAELGDPAARRVGIVHAVANSLALGLQVASFRARRQGRRGRGVALSAAAGAVVSFSGHLGGHLSYVRGVGVNQTSFDAGPDDWTDALAADTLLPGVPASVLVGDTPVLLLRHPDGIHAIHDRCSHRGCLLSGGEIQGEVVECACHGSRFRLADGGLERGPATVGQPSFDVREQAGRLQVRLRPADR
ncbi:MAG: iron-sulfur protein [Solirubrobacterales bacterium]|nr:iron-sulfur protein [Solirubrobacterales bacterium]